LFILYKLLQSCRTPQHQNTDPRPRRPGTDRPSPPGGFPGNTGDQDSPPPPYMPYEKPTSDPSRQSSSGPGFWTGAALAGVGTYLLTRGDRDRERRAYDWERERAGARPEWRRGNSYNSRLRWDNDDRGEGPSNLGSMRTSTGFGGSNVR
jgi:hypothetical protein